MFRQRAAHKEVLEVLRSSPIAGYGLYHLLDDAGLISNRTKTELEPLLIQVEKRLRLNDSELELTLPLKYEPMTDEEFDTLTYLIGELIRNFIEALPYNSAELTLAELRGINSTLEKHIGETSSLKREVMEEQVLFPLLRAWGEEFKPYDLFKTREIRAGDYFHVRNLARSMRWFPKAYVIERRLNRGEVVRVLDVWRKGYLHVERLGYKARYTRKWRIRRTRQQLPKDNKEAVVYHQEGRLYRLDPLFVNPVLEFTELFQHHSIDYSSDPERYRPRVPLDKIGRTE